MSLWRAWMLTGRVGLGALLVLAGAQTSAAQDSALPSPPFGLLYEANSPVPARAEVPRAYRGLFTPESSLPAPQLPKAGHSTVFVLPSPIQSADPATTSSLEKGSIAWRSLLRDSIVLLLVQQTYRLTLEDSGARDNLKGPFFKEWFALGQHPLLLGRWGQDDDELPVPPSVGVNGVVRLCQQPPRVAGDADWRQQPLLEGEGCSRPLLVHLQPELRDWAAVGSLHRQRWPEAR